MQRVAFLTRNGHMCPLMYHCIARRAFVDSLHFGHPSEAHPLNDALPVSEEGWIAAGSTSAEPAKCEARIERKSRLRCGPRLVQRAKQSQTSGKMEMRRG